MRVRVLVVDDSATMRGLITAVLHRDPQIEVVGQAANPYEARAAIKQLNPDVITLDIEMPHMNGLDFLEKIMRLRPTPVIMVSTLTQHGASTTLEALEIGAFDCVAKPLDGDYHDFNLLADKVNAAAKSRPQPLQGNSACRANLNVHHANFAPDGRMIAVGSSTGGVEALIAMLGQFPTNCPPTLVTQHMPPVFTKSFAQRLNRICLPEVSEAEDNMLILPGHVYLAPGNAHLEVTDTKKPRCRLRENERVSGHRPSVDVLFSSMARVVGNRSIGVILTGMGRDGAQGLLEMRQAGAETIGQDEASCVVYGMPKAAFEIGAVVQQLPLRKIAAHVLDTANLHNIGKS